MNIHQRADSGNNKNTLEQTNNLPYLPSEGWMINGVLIAEAKNVSNHVLNLESVTNDEVLKNSIVDLHLFDRLGRETKLEIGLGHVCIFSVNDAARTSLTIDIFNAFWVEAKPFEIIKGSDFVKLSNAQKSNSEIQYLIQIDLENISYVELCEIIIFCKTNFIFKIPGLSLNPKAEVEDKGGLGSVLCAFRAESNLIKHLVASLSEEEFVVISDGKPFVRSLVMEKPALLLENN